MPETDIDTLIRRLEKSEGPSRELDAELVILFDIRPAWLQRSKGEIWLDKQHYCIRWKDGRSKRPSPGNPPAWYLLGKGDERAPALTGSVDAAIALCERVLPRYGRSMSKGRTRPDEPLYGCQIYLSDYAPREEDMVVVSEAEHEVEAICLCLGILKAVREQKS